MLVLGRRGKLDVCMGGFGMKGTFECGSSRKVESARSILSSKIDVSITGRAVAYKARSWLIVIDTHLRDLTTVSQIAEGVGTGEYKLSSAVAFCPPLLNYFSRFASRLLEGLFSFEIR